MKGIIFIGLQGSGKSTFFLQNFYKTHLRLNMDMLRTRHRESILFNACLQAKQPVVIDNTNPTREVREKYLALFKQHKFSVDAYYFSDSFDDCYLRNSLREGKERINDIGIKATAKKLQKPTWEEGFSHIYEVNLKENQFSVSEWKNEV